jgi:ATP-dependent helicase/nuclease subunit A
MQTGAREVLAARGIQSLANLNKLVRTVRSLQGNATFSEVIATMARMDEEEIAESESRILEEQGDAVRVLSIHRAKGLDFPIVIAAGLGIRRRTRASDFLADPHGTRTFGLSLGAGEAGLRTLGWEDLCEAERAREDAELVRLLYVALTRARDRLVLSTYTRGRRSPDSDSWEAGYAGTRLQPLARFLADLPNRAVPPVRFLDPAAIPASMPARARSGEPPEPDLSALLAERYGALRKAVAETPGARSLHRASEADGRAGDEAGEREFARARAVRIGVAFHSVMERIAWDRPADAGVLAREEGLRRRLAGSDIRDLTEMVNRTLGSSLMERMRRSLGAGRRVLRELPYVRPLDPERQGIEDG